MFLPPLTFHGGVLRPLDCDRWISSRCWSSTVVFLPPLTFHGGVFTTANFSRWCFATVGLRPLDFLAVANPSHWTPSVRILPGTSTRFGSEFPTFHGGVFSTASSPRWCFATVGLRPLDSLRWCPVIILHRDSMNHRFSVIFKFSDT